MMFPMRLRAVVTLAALALTSPAAWPADEPRAPTREEEKLLADAGRRVLRDGSWDTPALYANHDGLLPRCVLLVTTPDLITGRFQDASDWLVQQLHRYAPQIEGCPDENTHPVFFLGPVVWIKPSQDAYIYYGAFSATEPRSRFVAHRGFLGRWNLTHMSQE